MELSACFTVHRPTRDQPGGIAEFKVVKASQLLYKKGAIPDDGETHRIELTQITATAIMCEPMAVSIIQQVGGARAIRDPLHSASPRVENSSSKEVKRVTSSFNGEYKAVAHVAGPLYVEAVYGDAKPARDVLFAILFNKSIDVMPEKWHGLFQIECTYKHVDNKARAAAAIAVKKRDAKKTKATAFAKGKLAKAAGGVTAGVSEWSKKMQAAKKKKARARARLAKATGNLGKASGAIGAKKKLAAARGRATATGAVARKKKTVATKRARDSEGL